MQNSGLDLEAEEDADRWDVSLSSTPGENNRTVFDHSRLEKEVEEVFSRFGTVTKVDVFWGLTVVHFSIPESGARATTSINWTGFKGRHVLVFPDIQRPSNNEDEDIVSIDQGFKTLKLQREEESKVAEASFMRPDTVRKQLKNGENVSMELDQLLA